MTDTAISVGKQVVEHYMVLMEGWSLLPANSSKYAGVQPLPMETHEMFIARAEEANAARVAMLIDLIDEEIDRVRGIAAFAPGDRSSS